MENKRYPIELEVVTPLSVGAGNEREWVKGLDFVQHEGKTYVLDIQKAVSQDIDLVRLTNLFIRYDEKGIINMIGNKLKNVSKYIFNTSIKTDNNIKSFLRTQYYGKPIVAGSSLKGAIRSALFSQLRDTERDDKAVFGTMNDGTDFMRFIQVGDIEMGDTILVNSKIFNLRGSGSQWEGGWKSGKTNNEGDTFTTANYSPVGFNTLYECVAPGEKGLGSIVLASNAFDLMSRRGHAPMTHVEEKGRLIYARIDELFKAINSVTKGYLKKEKSFFEKYPAQRTEEIIACIDHLLSLIPTDGSSCLLKMSAGVGFHSITGDWQFDDYDKTGVWEKDKKAGKKKYKSRKTVEYNGQLELMGFVRLRCLSNDQVKSREQQLHAEHQSIIASILAPIEERETALLRKKEEERQRAETRAAENLRRTNYMQLMQDAEALYGKDNWDEAIAKAEDAAQIGPDYQEHVSFIERCKVQKNAADIRKGLEDEDKKRFQQPLKTALQGKTSVGNIIGTTAKWVKINNTFGDIEFQALIESLAGMSKKDIKKKLKDLEKAVGKAWSDKIVQELMI